MDKIRGSKGSNFFSHLIANSSLCGREGGREGEREIDREREREREGEGKGVSCMIKYLYL